MSRLTSASYGGPKLVGINLTNNTVFKTIVFPPTVAYPDSYLNDVRFDLRSNLSGVNKSGVAYLTDSSSEGRDGLIIVDLASGNSWRHLNSDSRVHPELQFVPFVAGQPYYGFMAGQPRSYIAFGADGIALSKDGSTLYFAPTSGHYLYSIATSLLRAHGDNSEVNAQMGVQSLTQKGVSDGFETDTNGQYLDLPLYTTISRSLLTRLPRVLGFIYMGNCEQNAVVFWNPNNSSMTTFVRDPRLLWIDTCKLSGMRCSRAY